MIVIGIFLSCENEAIPYYNSENDAVRFSNKTVMDMVVME